jgi:hypothetical protein
METWEGDVEVRLRDRDKSPGSEIRKEGHGYQIERGHSNHSHHSRIETWGGDMEVKLRDRGGDK